VDAFAQTRWCSVIELIRPQRRCERPMPSNLVGARGAGGEMSLDLEHARRVKLGVDVRVQQFTKTAAIHE
jgi:hypothetical protein